ncbi:hypothetical protein K1719_036371 [Acacia pycnantha]|nr:hypothetical protein K1719_036371 [Acacia pycnantha]
MVDLHHFLNSGLVFLIEVDAEFSFSPGSRRPRENVNVKQNRTEQRRMPASFTDGINGDPFLRVLHETISFLVPSKFQQWSR